MKKLQELIQRFFHRKPMRLLTHRAGRDERSSESSQSASSLNWQYRKCKQTNVVGIFLVFEWESFGAIKLFINFEIVYRAITIDAYMGISRLFLNF